MNAEKCAACSESKQLMKTAMAFIGRGAILRD
jgi:hypothetical protein